MLTIKKILCPVDFSVFARSAFDRAVAIARLQNASITVLHVLPPASAPLPEYAGLASTAPVVDRQHVQRDLRAYLSVGESVGVPVAFEIAEAPDVAWEILARAQRLPADLIVLGTHGRSGFERLLFGSVAEKVLRAAGAPVLTIPRDAPDVVPLGVSPFRRILCATDFSDCATAAREYAATLAEAPDALLTVAHVVEVTPPLSMPIMGPPLDSAGFQGLFEQTAREELHRFVSPVAERCRVAEVIAIGKPYREILRIAGETHADLIVLGMHGRGAIDRLMFGTTAEPIVRRASCPVLTVRSVGRGAVAAA